MTSVNLCVIATSRYKEFIPALLKGAEQFFMTGHDVRYHFFTDVLPESPWKSNKPIVWHLWPHKPWPMPTLLRYHAMLSAARELLDAESTFYVDVDQKFVGPVGEEIIGDLVATRHHGYMNTPINQLPYERRLESKACILPNRGVAYYCGGFQGGRTLTWLSAMETMRDMIDADQQAGITPKHHDESIWNAFLLQTPPTLVLPPQYCWSLYHPVHRPYSVFDPNNPPKISCIVKPDKELHQ